MIFGADSRGRRREAMDSRDLVSILPWIFELDDATRAGREAERNETAVQAARRGAFYCADARTEGAFRRAAQTATQKFRFVLRGLALTCSSRGATSRGDASRVAKTGRRASWPGPQRKIATFWAKTSTRGRERLALGVDWALVAAPSRRSVAPTLRDARARAPRLEGVEVVNVTGEIQALVPLMDALGRGAPRRSRARGSEILSTSRWAASCRSWST